ncbi:MAG: VanZ family protein [Cyanobacteria bacterium]|nr:VanZ family protein [Cyanobacteriota bacterium]
MTEKNQSAPSQTPVSPPGPSRFALAVSRPVRLVLLVLWLLVIFAFSSQAHSGAVTEAYLGDFNVLVRKLCHVSEYFILCLLFYWNLSPGSGGKKVGGAAGALRCHPVVLSIVLTILYSVSDEWHQSFVPGRSASASDVMVDCVGVVIASVILTSLRRRNVVENASNVPRS